MKSNLELIPKSSAKVSSDCIEDFFNNLFKTENEQKTEIQNKSRVSSFIMNSWITTTYGFERFKKEVTGIVDLINNLII